MDGNGIAGDADFASFAVDTVLPTAVLAPPTNVNAATPTDTTEVVVTYADAGSGIDTTTFGTGNIAVGNGATVTSFSAVGNTVTYTVTAPSITWAGSPQGTYVVSLVAASVKDQAGNGIAGVASFGSFEVDTTSPTATLDLASDVNASSAFVGTTTVTLTYADAGSGIDASSFGIDDITVDNGATVTAFAVSGNTVTYTITAPNGNWAESPQGDYTVSLVGQANTPPTLTAGIGILGDPG